MEGRKSKREVPKLLRKVLAVDAKVSNDICVIMNKFAPMRSLKQHSKALEITGHGILWFAGWTAFIWFINSSKLYQMQINFLMGLTLDIVLIALLKAFVRRRRPVSSGPDVTGFFGPDVYSFPSGHASRAAFIAGFFIFMFPLSFFCFPPLVAWTVSICLSRVLMKRHYILDVLAGILIGCFELIVVKFLWLSQGTCVQLLSIVGSGNLEE